MKKIKLLTPMLLTTTLSFVTTPIIGSCSKQSICEYDWFGDIPNPTPISTSDHVSGEQLTEMLVQKFKANPKLFGDIITQHYMLNLAQDKSKYTAFDGESKPIFTFKIENLKFNESDEFEEKMGWRYVFSAKFTWIKKCKITSEHPGEYTDVEITLEVENLPVVAYFEYYFKQIYLTNMQIITPENYNMPMFSFNRFKCRQKVSGAIWNEITKELQTSTYKGIELIWDGTKWNTDEIPQEDRTEVMYAFSNSVKYLLMRLQERRPLPFFDNVITGRVVKMIYGLSPSTMNLIPHKTPMSFKVDYENIDVHAKTTSSIKLDQFDGVAQTFSNIGSGNCDFQNSKISLQGNEKSARTSPYDNVYVNIDFERKIIISPSEYATQNFFTMRNSCIGSYTVKILTQE